jgi:hypothetical protein
MKSCYPGPPAPHPPAAPQTPQQMTVPGEWTPDIAVAQTVEAQRQRYSDFFGRLASGLPSGDGGGNGDGTPSRTNWWLVGGIALLAGILILKR